MTQVAANRSRAAVAGALAAAWPAAPPATTALATAPAGEPPSRRNAHRLRRGVAEDDLHRARPRSSRPRTPAPRSTLNFAGSSDLVTQISQGAPADVFASADTKNMAKLTDADLVDGTPANFATNMLEIAVPPGNPASIASFADLAKPGREGWWSARRQVPCGAATETVEQATGTTLSPVSEESSVTDVLGKVTSGEADAGLVYVTDVKAAGDKVEGIPFPESDEAVNTYPIAAVRTSKNKDLAQRVHRTGHRRPTASRSSRDAGFGNARRTG